MMFDDLLRQQPARGETVWSAFTEPVHVEATEDAAKITIDMPGVAPGDVELTFEAGTLTIEGKRGERTYRYSVALGDAFDPERIDAQLEMGVLTVHAAKRPEARPRKITVKSAQKTLSAGEPH
jgi:HSP20 family protein